MSNPKGKGRAEPSKEAEAPATSTLSTIINNVASSASGLARSAFTAPSSNELTNAASSALTGAGKAQPSSSFTAGSPAWAESSKSTAGSFSNGGHLQSAHPQGLRSHQREHVAAAEADFSSFLDSVPVENNFETPGAQFVQPAQQGLDEVGLRSDARQSRDYPNPSSIQPSASIDGYKTVADAQAQDGADVLAILDTLKPEEMDYFEPQRIEDEIAEWRLTPEQMALIKRLAEELYSVPSPENPSNLLPQAFQNGDKEHWLPEDYAQDVYGHFGEVMGSEEAKGKWIEQWEDVLSRYQDEVWGNMLPLVKEAKEEIKENKETHGTEDHQPKALRRLGMVLGHIARAQTTSPVKNRNNNTPTPLHEPMTVLREEQDVERA